MESMYFEIKNVLTMKQDDNEGLTEFTKRFNNAIDIIETQHGPFALCLILDQGYRNNLSRVENCGSKKEKVIY